MSDQAHTTMVSFVDVNKWYGSAHILKDLTLDIGKNERVVVCGPSGSGKSTMIRCVNQLEEHQSGRVVVKGVELTDNRNSIRQVRRITGMVFQSFNLFPHMTVLGNLILAPMWVKKTARKEAADTAMHYLERVHIADQAHKYPRQLSGGQQQRAAIARTLCMRPEVMLLDEPTSALDPEMIKEVLDVLIELAHENMTMICVTHEMGFAREIGDTLVFMADGQIVEKGPPKDVFSNPREPRTRQFLSQVKHI